MVAADRLQMKILALVTDAFGGPGGIAAYNRHFLTALAEQGHEVLVLPRYGEAAALPAGLTQAQARNGRLFYVYSLLRQLLRDRSFDLVWCGHIGMAALAARVAAVVGCPWWLQIHGIDAWTPCDRTRQSAIRSASLVTAVSRYTRRRFLAWAPVPPDRVKVLPNVVEPCYTPGTKSQKLLQRYAARDCKILLTVGRIAKAEAYKGHDRIIRLMPRLLERHTNLVYLIAGDGDGRPELERLAAETGVEEQVRFAGNVAADELVDHYRIADVFVMPSTGEGFGIVYLEAMACGIPAIGLDTDGSIDPLGALSNGRAVPEHLLFETICESLDGAGSRASGAVSGFQPTDLSTDVRRLLRNAAFSCASKP